MAAAALAAISIGFRNPRAKMAAVFAMVIFAGRITPMESRLLFDTGEEYSGGHYRALKVLGDIVRTAIGARPRDWTISANVGAGFEYPGGDGPIRVDATTGGSVESNVANVPLPGEDPFANGGDPFLNGGFPPPLPPFDPQFQPPPFFGPPPFVPPPFGAPPFAPPPFGPPGFPPPVGQPPGQPFGVAGAFYHPGLPLPQSRLIPLG